MKFIISFIKKNNFFFSSAVILFLFTNFANISSYFFQILVGRNLDTNLYSVFQTLNSFSTLFTILMSILIFGILKYSNDKKKEYINFFYLISLIFIVFVILIFISYRLIGKLFLLNISYDLIFVSQITSILIIFLSIPYAILQFKKKIFIYSLASSFTLFIKLILLILCLYLLEFSITELIYLVFISVILSIIFSYYFVLKDIFNNTVKINFISFLKDSPKYLSNSFFYYLSFTIIFNLDIPLSRIFLDQSQFGSYAASSTIAKIPYYLFSIILPILLPELLSRDPNKRSKSYLLISLSGLSFGCFFLLIATYLYPNLILSITFGLAYNSEINFLFILTLSFFIICIFNFYLLYLLSENNILPSLIFFVGGLMYFIFLKILNLGDFFVYIHLSTSIIMLIIATVHYIFSKKTLLNF